MSEILNRAGINAVLGAGSVVLNDYALNITPIERGYRLTVKRGSETQTMDIMDGAQGQKGDKGDKGDTGAQGEPGKDAPQDVVRYAAQSLVAEQQAQARENIGAADAETVNGLKDDLTDVDEVLNIKHLRKISVTTTGSYQRAIAFSGLSLISGHSYTFTVKPVSITTQEFYLYFVDSNDTERACSAP